MEGELKMNIIYVFVNPKKFFKKLKNDNNYKKHFLYLFIISIGLYMSWFGKILSKLNYDEQEILIYGYFFDLLNLKFVYYLMIFLIVDVVIVCIFTIIIAILSKYISLLFNVKLSFKNFWKITIYSLTPIILTLLINIVSYLFDWKYIPFYIQYLPDLLVLFLLIIGIMTTSNYL